MTEELGGAMTETPLMRLGDHHPWVAMCLYVLPGVMTLDVLWAVVLNWREIRGR